MFFFFKTAQFLVLTLTFLEFDLKKKRNCKHRHGLWDRD